MCPSDKESQQHLVIRSSAGTPTLCSVPTRSIWSAGSSAGPLHTTETKPHWSESSKGPQRKLRALSTWHMGRGWELGLLSWDCLRWVLIGMNKCPVGEVKKTGPPIFSGRMRGNRRKSENRKYLVKMREEKSLLWGWSNTGANCPNRLWTLQPCKHSEADWMWPWATYSTWSSVELVFGLDDLQIFSNLRFSMILFSWNILCWEAGVGMWFLHSWIQFCTHVLLTIISAIRRISNDKLLLVIGCICKIRPLINSRNSLLSSPCFQLHVVDCSLTELSTGLHSIHTSLVRQVWWKEGINNLCSFKNMHKYITENIKTSGKGDIII